MSVGQAFQKMLSEIGPLLTELTETTIFAKIVKQDKIRSYNPDPNTADIDFTARRFFLLPRQQTR